MELLDEHEREDLWRDSAGVSSPAYWLSLRAGLPQGAGRALIELAAQLRALPALKASFAAGRLTMEQVKAVAAIATPETDAQLTELAEGLSGAQLTSFCRHYRRALRAGEDPSPRRRLRFSYGNEGTCRLSALLRSEDAALIEKALVAMEDELEPDEDADDPYAARRADALVAVAESSLAADPKVRPGAERYQVVVHTDVAVLQSQGGGEDDEGEDRDERAPYLEKGGVVSEHSVRRIACEAQIVELMERNGEPLSIGRASRRPTAAIRRAVTARDKSCRFPGCANQAYTETHHRNHWIRGGETSLHDLVLLCWKHHTAVHAHELGVEMTRDGPVFIGRDGRVIQRPPPPEATGPLEAAAIDEHTCVPTWGGAKGNMCEVADRFLLSWDSEASVPGGY